MRKPPEIASTRGKEQSFLDIIFEDKNHKHLAESEWSREQLSLDQQQLFLHTMWEIGINKCNDTKVIRTLISLFDHDQEYGLLNRLDTVTSGLLYFAKTSEVYDQRKTWQAESKIEKYYLTKVRGDIQAQEIDVPLWHHTNGKRMIAADEDLLSSRRKQKIKWWHLLPAHTKVVSTTDGYTKIRIYKGRRHQIRAHLAYIWHPITGETLYDEDENEKHLQLFSIGCKILV